MLPDPLSTRPSIHVHAYWGLGHETSGVSVCLSVNLSVCLYKVLHTMMTISILDRYDDVTCLVTTGHGKSYSTGLDIATTAPFIHDWDKMEHDMAVLHKLLARLLSYPMPTVAAMNGG